VWPKWLRRSLGLLLGVLFAAWSLLLLAWLILHWGILPHVDEWRPQIEQRASQAVGVPVRIGRIEVRSSGWVPALQLDDVVLYDTQRREALRLPRVAAALSVRSLWGFKLRFEQLLIDDARLELRRDAQGRLWVAGLLVRDDDGGDGAMTDWFFQQHEFAIRRGSLRWTDEQRNAPPLQLDDVNLVIRNGLRLHALRLDATPPREWGDRFSLRARLQQPLLARSGDWRRWSGSAHADLPHADLALLRRHVDLPFDLQSGEGAARAWFDIERGELRGATLDLALGSVDLRLQDSRERLQLAQVQGRLTARRDAAGVALGLQGVGFTTADGAVWPPGNLSLALRQRQPTAAQPGPHPITGGDFKADRLDLALLATLSERVPLAAPLRQWLADAAPQGLVGGLSAHWEGPVDAPDRYQLQAQIEGLTMAAGTADSGRPGIRGAAISLRATEGGGEAQLHLDGGGLEFPGVFDQPSIGFDRLAGQVSWRIEPDRQHGQPPRIEVKVKSLQFANADAAGDLSASWHTATGANRWPGVLEMNGRMARAHAASVARYLPLGVGAEARHYVAGAVRGGELHSLRFRVKGDLDRFPFANPRDGDFHVSATLADATLAYVPGDNGAPSAWPVFTRLGGELVFDHAAMELRNLQAKVYGVDLSRVQGGIRNLLDANPMLRIEGGARGPLNDLLRFVNNSPVGEWSDQALKQATGSGLGELKLALQMPLNHADDTVVKGSVSLLGNDVRLRPEAPLMAASRGRIDFTQKGFALVGVATRLLGGDSTVEGGTQADGSLRFNAQGTVSAEGLRRAAELPALARAAQSFSGQTAYRLSAGVNKGRLDVAFNSPLSGLALDLPAPLRKPADAALPLRVQLRPLEGAAGANPRDLLRIELGNLLQAQYQREWTQGRALVQRGAVAVQDTLPAPAATVPASVHLALLDVDAWQALLDRWAGPAGPEGPADSSYLPRQVALRVDELRLGGRRLTKVTANLTGEDAVWRASGAAEQLAGSAEYRLPRSGSGPGRLQARLSRLSLAENDEIDSLLEQAPSQVPALDIVVDDFELRGKRLGKLEIEAVNRGVGDGGREWRLAKLNLTVPEAQLQASGQWASGGTAPSRRMVLNFKLDVADGGQLLARLGSEGALSGAKGRLQGQVSWLGSPLSLDYPTLNGQINMALDKGRFLKASTGAARLLGVLSLQALPRRLALDFRDVFQDGFAFDNVVGDVQVRDGVASTNNLRMRGVQAAVLMEGHTDLERETQDLRVIVVPEINAGTASLAYAAINPAIGLGTFLAQVFLRKPLMQASTREFHVSGGWDDPKVERVQRKLDAPLPEIDGPKPQSGGSGDAVAIDQHPQEQP
jgi:uncharacterized protein (TIGR02099 family)